MKAKQRGVVYKSLIRLVRITPRKFRLRGFISFLFLFVNSGLDLIGLGAVIPLITVLLEDNAIEKSNLLQSIYDWMGFDAQQDLVIFLSATILGFILLKNLMSLAIQWYQAKFSYDLQRHFSSRLYRAYYNKGYLYFKSLNSANIVRNIQAVPSAFAANILMPLLSVVNEIVVVTFITCALLIYDAAIVGLLVAVVGPSFLLFYWFTKSLSRRIAEQQHEIAPLLSKNIIESVYGYLDVITTNTKLNFFGRHEDYQHRLAGLQTKSQVLKVAPNKILESALFLGVITIVVYGVLTFSERSELITLLGVFAISAYRIMPSVNRILMGVISLNGFRYTIDLIEGELYGSDNVQTDEELNLPLPFKKAINIEEVSFRYAPELPEVVTGINLKIQKGDSVGFVGKSGSGKSTLINLLLGFIFPQSGAIKIDNQVLTPNHLKDWRNKVGYVQQDVYLVDGSIRENVAFGLNLSKIDDEKIWKALEMASLAQFVKNLDDQLDHQVGERGGNLSGGQRQRIGIARSLYFGAEVLFFDEATSALDNETETEVTEAINKLQQSDLTMIIIAHRITTLKYCDHIYQLDEGHLVGEVSYETLVKEVV